MIPVTKPFLPPREDYQALVDQIFERNWLTNNGPLVNKLELRLKRYLGLSHLLYVGNGTIALQLAIKALGLTGEIITTPFSYVATTSSIVWEGGTPVFVDIDSQTLNIDPEKIEDAITDRTSAILATHCFGNPCDIDAIRTLADQYNLKVIYDAAHCFGTTYRGGSVFGFGDISATSFHATKLYHTIEGGAVITRDPDLLKRMAYMRNFGHDGPSAFNGVGINGKNSEMHAAMGLCNLDHIDDILSRRKQQCKTYDRLLKNLAVETPAVDANAESNHAYYPVLFRTHEAMQASLEALERKEISPRRYFHPSLSSLSYVPESHTPVSDDVAERVLCLPLYHTLTEEEQEMIARFLLRAQKYVHPRQATRPSA
jgi:dTDP-4-amino-4,6-dideoxygalactose transaminase